MRWRILIRAALAAPYYQSSQRLEQVNRCITRPTVPALLESLVRIEPVMVHEFFLRIREFKNRSAGQLPGQEAGTLWAHEGRLAVVEPWFRVVAPAKVLTEANARDLESFCPDVLAAPVEALRRLSGLAWPGPARAIVALTGIGRSWLTEVDRDQLWRRFGVPVYEQFRGFQGELLAGDCEAHGGMHVAAENGYIEVCNGELLLTSLVDVRYPVLRLATGIRASIDPSQCGCGLTAARLSGSVRSQGLARAASAG